MTNRPQGKIIRYGDRFSNLCLWQKAIFLLPAWAYLIVPFYGAIAMAGGGLVEEVAYAVMIIAAFAYFIEDVLKRKIRIENDTIFWGYRAYSLPQLVSISLGYRKKKVVPTDLVMDFSSGGCLKLRLDRISSEDYEGLLKLVENRLPHCKIDPVAGTLMRCKKLVRRDLADVSGTVMIPYKSRQLFRELADTFFGMTESWTRAGPLLGFFCFSVVWVSTSAGAFSLVKNFHFKPHLLDMLRDASSSIGSTLGKNFNVAQEGFTAVVSTPWVAWSLGLFALVALGYIMQILLRPNLIVVDAAGFRFAYRLPNGCFDICAFDWSEIKRVFLIKPKSISVGQWKVRFELNKVPPLDVDLASVDVEDRERLLRAIERWAPNCTVEAQLSEVMLRKQERSYTELWLQSLSAPPERASLEPLAPGQLLQDGRYEVIRRIGIGGQGAAYLCRETSQVNEGFCQEVVLKETIIPVYAEQTVRKQAIERFEQEAKLLKQLDNNRIVKLLDYFIEDHRGYLVLEHISGKNLRQLVEEEGPLTEDRIFSLAEQMCQMLEHLHSKAIIHRDFTPDNLILSEQGTLKLIDFNVAQQEQSGSTGTIVGKHAYLPPEQFRGKPTTQSDIYAMGATLYYLLTGSDPEPITQLRPRAAGLIVSENLDAVIAGSTALQCTKRFKNINYLAEVLHAAANSNGDHNSSSNGDAHSDPDYIQESGSDAQKSSQNSSQNSSQDGSVKIDLRVREHQEVLES